MKILGLDISSTCIGWGLLEVKDKNITLIKSGFIKPPKIGSIIERIVKTRDMVECIITDCMPDEIAIEDIILFMNKSTAKTVIMLTTFNRMVCLLARDKTLTSPFLYNVMSIRHGLKNNKILPKKEEMPDLVAQHLEFIFPYKLDRKGKRKVENYDEADGIAVALYHAFIHTGKIVRKIKKKPSKKKSSKVKK